jgi:hypothetical protein
MATNKTTYTGEDVISFINAFANNAQKQQDSFELIKLMQSITGFEPRMWGPSIVGFGNYHYRYESGHSGDAPITAFSPRKAAISLYVFTGLPKHEYLLQNLGKFKRGKACIYINKLSDIDLEKLKILIRETISYLKEKYVVEGKK